MDDREIDRRLSDIEDLLTAIALKVEAATIEEEKGVKKVKVIMPD